ncbi:uncharacterized protein LOC120737356 [Simochromis diagramma]|uniref:uncharacterized protein LOC120737356 n=1 Tax=Simochromis diagramma TaxID=43689 RepID=UPI001A7E27AA|nr:uncharacterized protein LOC120737356 [Simochromis diagramma]
MNCLHVLFFCFSAALHVVKSTALPGLSPPEETEAQYPEKSTELPEVSTPEDTSDPISASTTFPTTTKLYERELAEKSTTAQYPEKSTELPEVSTPEDTGDPVSVYTLIVIFTAVCATMVVTVVLVVLLLLFYKWKSKVETAGEFPAQDFYFFLVYLNIPLGMGTDKISSHWLIVTLISNQHTKDITFMQMNHMLLSQMFVNVGGVRARYKG